ncbi:protein ecdysoneless homolog [Dreissena polymorpha]|uniref:Ecdysoneless n=1 Tax=Dreissena polymorpha TaxID=45954 RepID=A0A9D4LSN6_DREPO|nr:protein ecdysoneless homolog [Dreissena polymorpha]KAH3863052.1 hypothetical protein DPMN_026029 [Dreissena polymorpha]
MAEKHNTVSDDVVEYFLFPRLSDLSDESKSEDNLNELLVKYLTTLSPDLIDVIWQNEGFQLSAVSDSGALPAHFIGQTNFGENIEDEWYIVYLLYQLTLRFPGLVARVHDTDEEFLLIEAADALPKWLNPETAENRVYIYNGELHIIPIPQSPSDVAKFPHGVTSVRDAIECIRKYPEQTRAACNVQILINNRINKFPGLVKEHKHYTHCYIPAVMAAILDEKPDLLAPAVRAFYYRDPIDLKCCRTFTYFRPGTRILHRTCMTRCLYAQLVHQSFQPDKRSGWIMPSTSSPKFRSHDLGMKLAHGFEILCHKAAEDGHSTPTNENVPTNNSRWQQYLKSLQKNNYFRGELEGSALYKKLLDDALKFYRVNMVKGVRRPDVGSQILHLVKTLNVDVEQRRLAEQDLPPPDDDSWITLTTETLDAMLSERGGNLDNVDDPDGVFNIGKVADSMNAFVKKISSVDGAEFPGAGEDDDDNEDIQFDGSGFITAMQEMFEFKDNDSVSSSDMSEYGWEEEDSDGEGKTKSQGKQSKMKRPPSLDRYMDVMDKELAKTEVGKSFERQSKVQTKKTSEKETGNKHKPTKARDIDEEDDDFQPVDIDLNTVRNFLESYGAQEGLAGPASNILGSMGIVLPPNMDNLPTPTNENSSSAITPTCSDNFVVTAKDPKPKSATVTQSAEMSASKPTPPVRPVVPPRRNTPSAPKSPGIKPPARPPPPSKDSKETDV